MMSHIRPRLRKPLGRAIAGTALVGAWAIGNPRWWLVIDRTSTRNLRASGHTRATPL